LSENSDEVMTDTFHRAIYLTGPTASGKTAIGVALAELLGAEIIAMDSMTLYRGLDIGTAKPTTEERREIPHHLIDVIDPWDSASVADYLRWAGEAIGDIESRGRQVLFVGGTALYLKALMRGLFDGPGADPDIRANLEKATDAELHVQLTQIDPITAARLHPANRRRVIRALEVFTLTGRPLSSFHEGHHHITEGLRVFALERPREEIHLRINARVVSMFENGLLDEVRRLQASPQPLNMVPAQGVGYREAITHLEGQMTIQEAIVRTQARTRQFAKRQGTWFRGLAECRPFPVEAQESVETVAKRLLQEIVAAN
jgi:tRNA dimethylallyltransferase